MVGPQVQPAAHPVLRHNALPATINTPFVPFVVTIFFLSPTLLQTAATRKYYDCFMPDGTVKVLISASLFFFLK